MLFHRIPVNSSPIQQFTILQFHEMMLHKKYKNWVNVSKPQCLFTYQYLFGTSRSQGNSWEAGLSQTPFPPCISQPPEKKLAQLSRWIQCKQVRTFPCMPGKPHFSPSQLNTDLKGLPEMYLNRLCLLHCELHYHLWIMSLANKLYILFFYKYRVIKIKKNVYYLMSSPQDNLRHFTLAHLGNQTPSFSGKYSTTLQLLNKDYLFTSYAPYHQVFI